MPSEKDKILEFNQYMKSDKMPYIIYADIEFLIRLIDGCANNAENASTTKIGERIPCVFSMSTIWAFDRIENKHNLYRGKDCMKKLWIFKRARKKYNWFWKEENVTVNKRRIKSHQDAKVCYICGKIIFKKFAHDKNYRKVRDHCHFAGTYRSVAHSICNLTFNVPNEIPVVFHSSSNYNYHFIIKDLANEFEGQF